MSDVASFTVDSIMPFVQKNQGDLRLDLFLKGVKCGHCVHKITQQIETHPELHKFQFAASGKRLTLWSDQSSLFSTLIDEIRGLGFEAIPISDTSEEQVAKAQFKAEIKRLAVAAVCAGNIMLFSSAVYLGAPEEFKYFFHKLSLILVVPVLFYSASSIWYGFYQSIKSLKFNLDFPIGLALAIGSLLSVLSFINGADTIYFDSIAVVVFLILSSRFVLNRYVNNIYLNNIVHFIPGVYQARIKTEEGTRVVALSELRRGQKVVVHRGEVVPVDGRLLSDQAIVDTSVLSGESQPIIVKKAERVFAGSRLSASECEIAVEEVGQDTRVGQYIEQAQKNQKRVQEESFVWVSRFTSLVVLASVVTFFIVLFSLGFNAAYQRAFAIILVACPCAISFGIPLIRSFSGQLAIKNGIILKQPKVLKKIATIKNIFLDKTGTLTKSSMGINAEDFKKFSTEDQQKILSLELSMDHPISRGFQQAFADKLSLRPVQDFQYEPGVGLSGRVSGELWKVQTDFDSQKKQLAVYKNGLKLGVIGLHSSLKDNLSGFLQEMAGLHYRISVLSGDQASEVEKIKTMIPEDRRGPFLALATPEQKQKMIADQEEESLMVGDGINDIAAMQAAELSICMPGALENNMNVADVTLTRGDLTSVLNVFRLAKKILSTEKRLLIFTFIYNIFCILAASFGYITPVVAAILMPISSITVLSIVTLSLRRL